MTPVRVQRRRVAGWTMPPNTVYVGRPTVWGNPDAIDPALRQHFAGDELARYRALFEGPLAHLLPPLRGKNLACWCALDRPCHADILLDLANRDHPEENYE